MNQDSKTSAENSNLFLFCLFDQWGVTIQWRRCRGREGEWRCCGNVCWEREQGRCETTARVSIHTSCWCNIEVVSNNTKPHASCFQSHCKRRAHHTSPKTCFLFSVTPQMLHRPRALKTATRYECIFPVLQLTLIFLCIGNLISCFCVYVLSQSECKGSCHFGWFELCYSQGTEKHTAKPKIVFPYQIHSSCVTMSKLQLSFLHRCVFAICMFWNVE